MKAKQEISLEDRRRKIKELDDLYLRVIMATGSIEIGGAVAEYVKYRDKLKEIGITGI